MFQRRSAGRIRNKWTLSSLYAAISVFIAQCAQAGSLPNDCWFGVLAPNKAPHGQIVATGPVLQWRAGMSLVLYRTKEDYDQLNALTEKGQTGTFDISHPFTVVLASIIGPEPGDKESGEDKSIYVSANYRSADGETGVIDLTYWTVMSMPAEQENAMAQMIQDMHDAVCRGVP